MISEGTMENQEKVISRVLEAIDRIRSGGMVIMVDDEDRENEGDLVFAAEFATADKINFMAKEARGLICLPLSPDLVSKLKLPLMDDLSKGPGGHSTAFTVSIEARFGVTTGISAADRAHTIRVAAAEGAKPEDLVVPGHIFPLIAKSGGVLERSGHTEGSVDLSRLSGCRPAAVICEIMNDDGTMARMVDLQKFSKTHNIPVVSIEDIISFRLMRDSLVRLIGEGETRTPKGSFKSALYESVIDGSQHFVLLKNPQNFTNTIVDVRVHRQRPLNDVFNCDFDSSNLMTYGLDMLNTSSCGAFIYLSQGISGHNLWDFKEVAAPLLVSKDASAGSSPMDSRQLGVGAQIIRALGVHKMRIHVSAQRNLIGLAGFGLEVCDTIVIPHGNS
jgi:3,4-dihydroxy 2-butanone 4-phosphate synthase/GTP cyclohydrolase II